MRHVHRVKIGTVERRSLGPRRHPELRSGYGYRRYSKILQIYRVVQTARCARPSIGQCLDNGVYGSKLFDDSGRSRLRERGFRHAHNTRHVKALAEQALQSIEEEVAAGLADIQQSDGLALQTSQPCGRHRDSYW